jgi:hypothetical protein
MRNMHMPTDRLLVGSVALSAQPGPTLTAVVAVEVAAQVNAVVASLGVAVAGVAGPMDAHAHTSTTSTLLTLTTTLQPRNGKSSVRCTVS